jgi:hypothetical protein
VVGMGAAAADVKIGAVGGVVVLGGQ